jgi:hypothetical protein
MNHDLKRLKGILNTYLEKKADQRPKDGQNDKKYITSLEA